MQTLLLPLLTLLLLNPMSPWWYLLFHVLCVELKNCRSYIFLWSFLFPWMLPHSILGFLLPIRWSLFNLLLISSASFSLFIYIYLFIYWLHCTAYGILIPQPGIEPVSPTVEAWSPNHWTAREVPRLPPLMLLILGFNLTLFYAHLTLPCWLIDSSPWLCTHILETPKYISYTKLLSSLIDHILKFFISFWIYYSFVKLHMIMCSW